MPAQIARPVPDGLDWEFWLGPAPYKPYFRHRTHGSFRGYWDYDSGGLGDMGQHYLDPLQYVLDKDHTSPVEAWADAPWPSHPDAVQLWGTVWLRYEDGTTIILNSAEWGKAESGELPFMEGPRGKVYGNYRTDPPGLFGKVEAMPDPPALIDFHTAIRTRRPSGGNDESSHRSACLLHLSNIAIRTGRRVRFDPVALDFPGDEEANRLADVPLRAPWRL